MAEYAHPWEKAAMDGAPMPQGLPLEEQLAFQALAYLYARYRAGQVSREQGAEEKGRILYRLERDRRQMCTQEKLVESATRMYRELEAAANAYARERTVENGDKLYRAVYRVEPGTGDGCPHWEERAHDTGEPV